MEVWHNEAGDDVDTMKMLADDGAEVLHRKQVPGSFSDWFSSYDAENRVRDGTEVKGFADTFIEGGENGGDLFGSVSDRKSLSRLSDYGQIQSIYEAYGDLSQVDEEEEDYGIF